MFAFKQFQREDYARAACQDGVILGHDTGGGKTIAAFTWTALKAGFQYPATALHPLRPVLIIAPGDLHQQIMEEGAEHFRAQVTLLDSQETFLKLARPRPNGGYELDPGYYLTSYTQLTGNGVAPFPKCEGIEGLIQNEPTALRHREYGERIGEHRYYGGKEQGAAIFAVKCVYSPALVDLCQDCFCAVAVDEGVRMKGEDTIIGVGVRQLTAPYRLVLTATPIKNRLPDVFRLAWWATGGRREAHARFPYPDDSTARDEFAREFMVSERNLSREEKSADDGKPRRFRKLTPQVCNVHRLWKLFAPIILRRRKADFGEDIVTKTRQVVHAPMGLEQARVYRYHLSARYRDRNGRPAIGAQLQALRTVSANPASPLLERPLHDATPGVVRSQYPYIPKVHSALKLIQRILQRGEQVVVFSAFHSSLDELASRLNQAGVPHCKLDGRMSQQRRAREASLFKLGPPRQSEISTLKSRISPYPVMLAGVECMAEGHSFHLCNNVILLAYSWAYDKFEQAINRAHRLNSRWDVNVYPIICEGSIDRKLESLIEEKADAVELTLDGKLVTEETRELNLAELLMIAQHEFNNIKVVDERQLEREWPALRDTLRAAAQSWSTSPSLSPRDRVPAWAGEGIPHRLRAIRHSAVVPPQAARSARPGRSAGSRSRPHSAFRRSSSVATLEGSPRVASFDSSPMVC